MSVYTDIADENIRFLSGADSVCFGDTKQFLFCTVFFQAFNHMVTLFR